ncbi:MAG: ABC transporter substrate-binding protein [Faecalibacterium sp.]
MKKISRRSFITAMAAVSAAGVLAACGSSSSSTASSVASSAVSSEATSSAASMDETGTHTVVDHGGNEVEVPNKVTRVVIDQIPILSTYMAYFEGSAPYIVGYCGSFKSVISDTVLKNIAPELLESSDTVYAQSDLNIEEIMKLNPDVILYNAGNSSHAEILKASGIPSIGFATVGASTEADPIERYEEWLKLLEQIFNEPGKTEAFVAAGDEIVADVEARIAEVPETDRPSALILWKYADGVPQVSGQGTFGTYWMKRLGVTDKALEATGFAQASMEQIYSWDPDILFLDGPGLQPLRTEDVLSGNVDGADFSTLTAVKSGRVYNTTLGILVVRTSSSWVSRATIRVFCWMAR